MKWVYVTGEEALSEFAAGHLLSAVAANRRSVLGLPTGRTPEGMYAEIVRRCRRERHCFSEATTFNLDEYVGIGSDHPGSYCSYMRRNLFDAVDLDPWRIHLPDGLAARIRREEPALSFDEALERECADYEQAISLAGGIDLTFLGLGTNGHIGFNEPGSSFESRTRVVELSPSTRLANGPLFAGQEVPSRAITMGIATIMESRAIVLLAAGKKKQEALSRLLGGEVSERFPASALHRHGDVTVAAVRE